MTDEERELLLRYQKYVRKRNTIVVILISITVFLGLGFYFFNKGNNETVKKSNVEVLPPVLELNKNSIEISQNDTIDYISYIKTATDEVDGDLKNKVIYNTIDTSLVGEYEIEYSLENSNHKKVIKKMKVKINEIIVSQPEISNDANTTGGSTSTSSNTSSTTTKPSTSTNKTIESSNNSNSVSTPKTKDFLFKDGYDMNTVSGACASSLSGHRGRCDPIYDSDGIIIGMRATIE